MNKKLKNYFEQLGLKIVNNNAYGTLNGYEVSVNVAMLDPVEPVKMHVNLYALEEIKENIVKDIKYYGFKSFTIKVDLFGISLGFNDPLTVGKLLVRMPDMIEKIFDVFKKYEALGVGYCPICGDALSEDSKQYKIGWGLVTVDNRCIEKVNNEIVSENKEFKERPNNYLKGTFGALLGALVGVIAFVVIFYFGYVTALTSFIAILLGAFLYRKFGGKPNAGMVVIVSITSIVSMLLTIWCIYMAVAEVLAPEYGYFSYTGLKAFQAMMKVKDFKQEFNTNFFLTAFYTLLGVGFEIFKLGKSIAREKTIK